MTALWLTTLLALASVELEDVLERVDGRVPELSAAQYEIDAAEAELLAARGSFDPALYGKGATYEGKDPRWVVETGLGGRTALGPAWSVGYQRGTGDFPPYAGESKTGPDGEWTGRLEVPLLRGLGFGEDRTDLVQARMGLSAQEAGWEATRVALRARAAAAWWKWVAAGAKLEVYEELLGMAERRADALALEVQKGQRARIDLVDNQRVLSERRADAARARGDLERAALALGLYYRDANGQPLVPDRSDLPELRPVEVEPLGGVEEALSRPDLQAARIDLERQRAGVKGARNQLLPELGASVEGSTPVRGGPSEVVLGATVDVPLALRKGRGDLREQRATEAAKSERLRAKTDMALAELEAAQVALQAAAERAQAADQALAHAREVADLERRRFELGGSELFTLLMREERVAKAGLELAEARLDHGLALAEWDRVRGVAP